MMPNRIGHYARRRGGRGRSCARRCRKRSVSGAADRPLSGLPRRPWMSMWRRSTRERGRKDIAQRDHRQRVVRSATNGFRLFGQRSPKDRSAASIIPIPSGMRGWVGALRLDDPSKPAAEGNIQGVGILRDITSSAQARHAANGAQGPGLRGAEEAPLCSRPMGLTFSQPNNRRQGEYRIELTGAVLGAAGMDTPLWACGFVMSLHRVEGHGRVIAEPMLRGLPFIATDWCTDF
jgi:hypothetical protein